jgi:predicted N-acetyltransferase YhbS
MNFTVRAEKESDYHAISEVIKATYKDVSYSNHKEQDMVSQLRNSKAFIPQLSIVADDENGALAGHILSTKIGIQTTDQLLEALALAPLSVTPHYQRIGMGSKLVLESHRIAKAMGYQFIVILGIANYYPKFGYQPASKYNLKLPIKISDENAMVISLTGNDLEKIANGTVIYPKEFWST